MLCVGDLMLDRFLYGEVERISPEAPVPVLRVSRERTMLGGAGNVVRNLVALGARATFVATIGNDRAGSTLATLVDAEEGVDARLMRTAGRASTVKSRYLAGGQQLLRADRDPDRPIGESVAADLADVAADAVLACDAVVLSDYGKGVVGEAVVGAVLTAAAAHRKPVIVDPKGNDFSRYRGAGTVTPNRAELAAASGAPTDGDEAVAEAARRLIADLDIARVLVTRGAAGMSLVTAGEAAHFPARAREVFDVSGAGDTAVAAFAAAVGAGLEPALAAQLANAAAGLAVGKVGTAVAGADELSAALQPRRGVGGRDQGRQPRARGGASRDLAPPRGAHRLRQWLFRPVAPRPSVVAAAGAGGVRPAGGRLEQRRLGGPPQGAGATGAGRGGARDGPRLAGICRPGDDLRRRYAARTYRAPAPGRPREGRRLRALGSGRREFRAALWRPRVARRT